MIEQTPRLIAILAEAEMRTFALQYVSDCKVDCMGPTNNWILIKTKTDAERNRLSSTAAISIEFVNILRRRGYSEALISDLVFTFESQETVDRDYSGNWYWALK